MKLVICLFALCTPVFAALAQLSDAAQKYQHAYGAWEAAAYAERAQERVRESFSLLQKTWTGAPEELRKEVAYGYAQAAVYTATRLVELGDHAEASALLAAAGNISKSYPVVLSRGKSPTAFQDLARLHAIIVSKTNTDPLRNLPIGYELEKSADGFYAFQESLPTERRTSLASPTELTDIKEDETAGTLLHLDSQGRQLEILPVSFRTSQDRSSSLQSRLRAVYKKHEAGPSGPGRFTRMTPELFFKSEVRNSLPAPIPEKNPRAEAGVMTKPPPKPTLDYSTAKDEKDATDWWLFSLAVCGVVALGWWLAARRKADTK